MFKPYSSVNVTLSVVNIFIGVCGYWYCEVTSCHDSPSSWKKKL